MKIGSARLPLAWSPGLPMAGYSRRTLPASGTHRELYLRAAVISSSDDGSQLCLVSIETLCVDRELTRLIREGIERETGIPQGAIMVAATHTHASAGGIARFPVPTRDNVLGEYAPGRVEQVMRTAVEAAQQATKRQTPAHFAAGTGRTEGIAANRRDANAPHDPYLRCLLTESTVAGMPHTGIVSFACHPTILSADNLLYSGDLIGTACALLEARGGVAVALTGAAGDISTRFTRRESSVAEVEYMGRELASAALLAELKPVTGETLGYARQELRVPVKPLADRAALEQALGEAQARLAGMETSPERRVVEAEVEGLQFQLEMGERPAEITTEVQVFRVGSVFIVGLPGEMFVAYGLELVEALAPAQVLVAGYANDYIGYVTTPDAGSGYEAEVAVVPPEAGAMLINAALECARRLD